MVDWPDADNHFSMGVQRLTRIHTGDSRLFGYPWIYATQTGWWGLSDAETRCLREFLLRGGYLVVDDFWGPEQWEIFRRTMDRALPSGMALDVPHPAPFAPRARSISRSASRSSASSTVFGPDVT